MTSQQLLIIVLCNPTIFQFGTQNMKVVHLGFRDVEFFKISKFCKSELL